MTAAPLGHISGDERPLVTPLVDGATFVLDAPDHVPAIWGDGTDVLWAKGESLILAGPPGVGKTTLVGQIVRALIGLEPRTVLGHTVHTPTRKILYLAMDRPAQIARSLRRHFTQDERGALAERLTVWKGPPPEDLAKSPHTLSQLADQAGASVVILDSLKDAALGLTDDETGAGYNRARQLAITAGIQVLELHHTVKRGPNGARPNTLADLYGSAWITAGAGSVILLWGQAGDPIVDFIHLKQPAEPVGPMRLLHDHTAGVTSIWNPSSPLALVNAAGPHGTTVRDVAAAINETDTPDRNHIEKARRALEKLVDDQHITTRDDGHSPTGGKPTRRYLSNHESNHARD